MSFPVLWRASLRHLERHPAQMGLSILGVALGVAVVVAIHLANASAGRAFTLSSEAVNGRATHQVTGGPNGLPEGLFARLFRQPGSPGIAAAPVVEDFVLVPEKPGRPGRRLHLLGVDPLLERPFRSGTSGLEGGSFSLGPLLTRPGTVLLAEETAAAVGVDLGDRFDLVAGGRPQTVELAGTLEPAGDDARAALSDLLVADIATAQELLGRPGRLDRIDLLVPEGAAGEAALERAAALLPPEARIEATGTRTATHLEMTRAFRTNLTALSLLALVCGGFLIFNTMTFSVVQRRSLLGTLRALGVTRREILGLVLGEAAVIAALGTALGLAAGVGLGRGLVRMVTRTINDLYFAVSVTSLAVPVGTLLLGAALGVGATLLAALVPALEAAGAPPRGALVRSDLEGRVRRGLPKAAAGAALLLAAGAAALAFPGGGLGLSFAGLFAVIVGFALLAPGATALLLGLARPLLGRAFGAVGRLAAASVTASLSRSGVAVAALTVAVAVAVGVGVMVHSFRGSVARWLDRSLAADIYVSAPGRGLASRAETLDPAVALLAERVPGLSRDSWIRRAQVPAARGTVQLVAIEAPRARLVRSFELLEGDPETVWPAFERGQVVAVSEPFFRRTGKGVGDTLVLTTLRGPRSFAVAGVYRDYASDQGNVLLVRHAYAALWGDPRLTGFSLNATGQGDLEPVLARLRTALAAEPALHVQSNRNLKRLSMAIFDRTFRITDVLRLLAGLVAAIGVLAALLALELERTREIGVLRAAGMTPGEVGGLVLAQTSLLGLVAGLLSLPLGLALSAIMVFVINRRSFGWTVELAAPPALLLGALALALGAALAAGIYPAWRMARIPPAAALREE